MNIKFNIKTHSQSFYIPSSQIDQHQIKITGTDAYHLKKALRAKEGDHVHCVGSYNEYLCEIVNIDTGKDRIEIILHIIFIKKKQPIKDKITINVYIGFPKPSTFSSLITKASEIGIDNLIPVLMERSFLKQAKKINLNRYEKIAIESMKQCKRSDCIKIKPPITLSEIQKQTTDKSLSIALWENAKKDSSLIKIIKENKNHNFSIINSLIGPEGGISIKEIQQLKALNFKICSINSSILKVETALIMSYSYISLLLPH